MNFRTLFLSVTLVLGLFSCQSVDKQPEILTKEKPSAPVAEKRDSVLTIHNDTRVDPYFWMRLSDEQKVAETPDAQTQQVLDYLQAENAYTEEVMSHTEKLQEKLYEEMVGRIKQNDESVPYFKNGYWYYTVLKRARNIPSTAAKRGPWMRRKRPYWT